MQKDNSTISHGYPWGEAAEGMPLFNSSAEYGHSVAPGNITQSTGPAAQSLMAYRNEPVESLREQSHEASPELSRTVTRLSPYESHPRKSGQGESSVPANGTSHPYIHGPSTAPPSSIPTQLGGEPQSQILMAVSPEPHQPGRQRRVAETKRAAQNRSAQKAFRERREKYVKGLEATAAQAAQLQKTVGQLREENAKLREQNFALESKLMALTAAGTGALP
ncbi:hypothetical protein METBIDRAFT_102264 [Metschnikowia bicuspidata var. bicuspidata NRRL YB-4993]|uniref:BZIP domain-containing protein n=1 Tax=Metschnikowia bicuspidata var. bicuspidata NRRL YB-4993 TaxID=869754 RepID=A0A1A0HGW6_9ASCO|nr:hypothetical protein METBIDRAFT_102264 [Metschnikowia bicuspidata var. bicuspidata NRRL YB-4993]OBA23235.1 hypothetical protein METBIDRAFT_102264 [Metschnikowia bicuspidata var. bicuspidata NRRL YB-4993]